MTKRAASPRSKGTSVFISYSHKDERLRERLEAHLSALKRDGVIRTWTDRQISPGSEWQSQIREELEQADIVILLVSPAFLASNYAADTELRRALERHRSGESVVVPVILRPCDWAESPIAGLQALPTDGKPVTLWKNQDAAFADVAVRLKKIIEHRAPTQHPKPTRWSVVLSGTVDEVDAKQLEAIVEKLREVAGDASITLKKVEPGSVVLFLEGSQETAEILAYLIKNGMLKDVCGCKVKGVGLSPDPLETTSSYDGNPDEVLNEIRSIENNDHNIRRVVEQLRSPIGVLPFVGAGLSIPFGYPGWTDFLLLQAQATGMRNKVSRMLRQGQYEEAAGEIECALTPFGLRSAIEDKYGDHVIAGREITGPPRLLSKLTNGPVLTTNFDRILEHAFEADGQPFEVVVCGAKPDMINKAVQQGRRRLIKLHGDWEESSDRILTKAEYEEHYGTTDSQYDPDLPLPRILRSILVGRSLLFVGCGLNQDRTVRILQRVASESQEIGHYAIVELPASIKRRREKNKFMAGHNIRPIWYPTGKHNYVEIILIILASHKAKNTSQVNGSRARSDPALKRETDRRING